MSEAEAKPDTDEGGPPLMITIMVRMKEPLGLACGYDINRIADLTRKEFNREVAYYIGADETSTIVDCQTLSPREDKFFRNIPGAWKAKG